MEKTSPLINAERLSAVIDGNTVIVDARSGPDVKDRYKAGHIDGAILVDLDRDLSQKPVDAAYGGRHPLPALRDFAALLGRLGITPSKRVLVYDDKAGANAAARFWWMLKSVGHQEVYVINGGLAGARNAGIVLSSEDVMPISVTPYPVEEWNLPTAAIEEVAKYARDKDYVVIDVREGYRYLGESEPIDLVAGHIPGAVNIPYLNNIQQDGLFYSSEELKEFYNSKLGKHNPAQVIVHCGSGVTACHTLLAMEHAGISGAKLYVGSWSEWSRRDLPIAKGPEQAS